jgi:hypothetical protein
VLPCEASFAAHQVCAHGPQLRLLGAQLADVLVAFDLVLLVSVRAQPWFNVLDPLLLHVGTADSRRRPENTVGGRRRRTNPRFAEARHLEPTPVRRRGGDWGSFRLHECISGLPHQLVPAADAFLVAFLRDAEASRHDAAGSRIPHHAVEPVVRMLW